MKLISLLCSIIGAHAYQVMRFNRSREDRFRSALASGLSDISRWIPDNTLEVKPYNVQTGAGPSTCDGFGAVISMYGNFLAVAAPFDGWCSTGINGDRADYSCFGGGAVYVYHKSPLGLWNLDAYLKASYLADSLHWSHSGGGFGHSISLYDDVLAVGAPYEDSCAVGINGNQTIGGCSDSGAVYIFRRSDGGWAQEAYLKASNTRSDNSASARFGSSVSLHGDVLAVGAPLEEGCAVGIDGNQADFGMCIGAGAVYVFYRENGQQWSQVAYIKAFNNRPGYPFAFGYTVSLSGSGLAVGAQGGQQTTVYVYRKPSDSQWVLESYWSEDYGTRNASITLFDNILAVASMNEASCEGGVREEPSTSTGCASSGAVLLYSSYVNSTGQDSWKLDTYLKAPTPRPNAYFGNSVSLSSNGIAITAAGDFSCPVELLGVPSNESWIYCPAISVGFGTLFVYIKGLNGKWVLSTFMKQTDPSVLGHLGSSVSYFDGVVAVAVAQWGSSLICPQKVFIYHNADILNPSNAPSFQPFWLGIAPPASLPALLPTSVPVVGPVQVGLLGPVQVPLLFGDQMQGIVPKQISSVAPVQVPLLTPDKLLYVPPTLVPAMSELQIPSLQDLSFVPLFSPSLIRVIPPRMVDSVAPSDIPLLSPESAFHITRSKYQWLSPVQLQDINSTIFVQNPTPTPDPPPPVAAPWGSADCSRALVPLFIVSLLLCLVIYFLLYCMQLNVDKHVRRENMEVSTTEMLVFMATEVIDFGTDWMALLMARSAGDLSFAPCLDTTLLVLNVINTVAFFVEAPFFVLGLFGRAKKVTRYILQPRVMNMLLAFHLAIEDLPQIGVIAVVDAMDAGGSTWLAVNSGFTALIVIVKLTMHVLSVYLELRKVRVKAYDDMWADALLPPEENVEVELVRV